MTSRLQYWCKKQCSDCPFSHVKTFFCFKQFAERLTTVVKAIFVFTVKKSSQPLNSLLLEIHVPFLTNLASIFLTFSVTRAIVSSVFRGQDDIEEGLLTCDDVELKCCCGEKRTLLLLFNVCCCFFKVIFRRSPNFLWDCRDRASTLAGGHLGFKYAESSLVMNIQIYLGGQGRFESSLVMNIKIYLGGRGWFESSLVMNIKICLEGQGWFESSLVMNIKINLRGWGWFESSLLVMNIQIYLGGRGRFESSLVMNIKIYLGDRGWFESSLVMNIKIYLEGQGWFESSLIRNIKINLRGWGWFESSLLVMNIQIYLGGRGRFESSLVMNIKIYLGDRGWFESSLVMNIKIYLGGQGWFGRRRFFSSPSSGPHLWKILGFIPSIHLKPRWLPTMGSAWSQQSNRKQGKCEQSLHIYLYFLTFDLSGAVWEPDAFDSVN